MAIRLRLAEILKARKLSAYALGKGAGLNYPTVHRMSRSGATFRRLDADTLNRLCEFLGVQPGELLEFIPDRKQRAENSVTNTKFLHYVTGVPRRRA